jgi:ArsR family transcriptional regulator
MINDVRALKALADVNRLRLMALLSRGELFVCQLMAVTGLSQPLISRSLALLERAGLLQSRRQGKHVFYRICPSMPAVARAALAALDHAAPGSPLARDRSSLELFCRRFRGGQGCDMAVVRRFMDFKEKNQTKEN